MADELILRRDPNLTTPPADNDMLERAVANCAGVYRVSAERMGKRSRLWDDLSCADLELPVALPPNIAVVLREPLRDEADTLPQRVAEFYYQRPGGPYGIWSLWPLEGLPPDPLDLWDIPIMVRDAGGDAPVAPAGLEIIEATDASTVREGGNAHRRVVRSAVQTGRHTDARLTTFACGWVASTAAR